MKWDLVHSYHILRWVTENGSGIYYVMLGVGVDLMICGQPALICLNCGCFMQLPYSYRLSENSTMRDGVDCYNLSLVHVDYLLEALEN